MVFWGSSGFRPEGADWLMVAFRVNGGVVGFAEPNDVEGFGVILVVWLGRQCSTSDTRFADKLSPFDVNVGVPPGVGAEALFFGWRVPLTVSAGGDGVAVIAGALVWATRRTAGAGVFDHVFHCNRGLAVVNTKSPKTGVFRPLLAGELPEPSDLQTSAALTPGLPGWVSAGRGDGYWPGCVDGGACSLAGCGGHFRG